MRGRVGGAAVGSVQGAGRIWAACSRKEGYGITGTRHGVYFALLEVGMLPAAVHGPGSIAYRGLARGVVGVLVT